MAVVTLPIVDTPIAGCTYICAPKGRAGEYAPLAANPYRGCGQPQPSSFILQPNTWPKSLPANARRKARRKLPKTFMTGAAYLASVPSATPTPQLPYN